MGLSKVQAEYLRSMAIEPPVSIDVGAGGLTRYLLSSIDQALSAHELIRVRVPFGDKLRRARILSEIAPLSGSVIVDRAGHGALLYRPSANAVITLPES